MAYVDYEYYKSLYGEEKAIPEADFTRLHWDAEREIDKATTGIDGIRKLQVAFPTNDYDAEAVRRCVCELINFIYKLELAEIAANLARQYTEREDGSLQGRVVSSVSAGNESISYSVGKAVDTAISDAIKSARNKELEVSKFIMSKLRGIADANGVNLLYSGGYTGG